MSEKPKDEKLFSEFIERVLKQSERPLERSTIDLNKRKVGRPRKNPETLIRRSERPGEANRFGRVKKPKNRYAGAKHHKVKKARMKKLYWKRKAELGYPPSRTFDITMRGCYLRFKRKLKFRNKLHLWLLTYEEYVELWCSTPAVWNPIKLKFTKAWECKGNALTKEGCYLSRIDPNKPYTKDNCCIYYYGEILKNED